MASAKVKQDGDYPLVFEELGLMVILIFTFASKNIIFSMFTY